MKIQRSLNGDAFPNNMLQISKNEAGCCDGDDGMLCKYTGSYAFPILSIQFSIDGAAAVTHTFATPATNLAEFNAAMVALLATRQSESGMGAISSKSLYCSTSDGANLLFQAESDIVISQINGAAVTQECTPSLTAVCKINLPYGATVALDYNGIGAQNVVVPAAGDPAGTLIAANAALAAIPVTTKTNSVVEDTVNAMYVLTVEIVNGSCNLLTADGNASTFCFTRADYIA